MSRETAVRAIDFVFDRTTAAFSLSFFGGEPLLNRDVLEHAVRYADSRLQGRGSPSSWLAILSTNATLIDAAAAAWLKSLPNFTGLRAHVSLDGPAFVHDVHRKDVAGVGSHAKARAGIERLRELGIPILPVATLCPDTAEFAGEIASELLAVSSGRAVMGPNLRANWTESALAKLRSGLAAAAQVWAESLRAGSTIVFEPFAEKIHSHIRGGACPGRCQIALEDLVVAPSGRFYPCGEMVGPDTDLTCCIGDLSRGIDDAKIARLLEQKARIDIDCAGCSLRERCSSHCGCHHIALTGRLGSITDTLCKLETEIVDAADAVAEQLYAESCLGFIRMFYATPWQLIPGARLLSATKPGMEQNLPSTGKSVDHAE